jgi:hypothetical protein
VIAGGWHSADTLCVNPLPVWLHRLTYVHLIRMSGGQL